MDVGLRQAQTDSPEWHWDYQHNPLEREGNRRDEFVLWMSVFDRLRLTNETDSYLLKKYFIVPCAVQDPMNIYCSFFNGVE